MISLFKNFFCVNLCNLWYKFLVIPQLLIGIGNKKFIDIHFNKIYPEIENEYFRFP